MSSTVMCRTSSCSTIVVGSIGGRSLTSDSLTYILLQSLKLSQRSLIARAMIEPWKILHRIILICLEQLAEHNLVPHGVATPTHEDISRRTMWILLLLFSRGLEDCPDPKIV